MSSASQDSERTPQQLADSCQGLVRSIAWKIHRKLPSSVDLDDLIGYGQVGLAEAARDFDPTRGGRFTTYAYYRIRGAIFDGLSTMSWFSRHDYHRSKYERMAEQVLAEANADPSMDQQNLGQSAGWLSRVSTKLAVVSLACGGEDGGRAAQLEDRATPGPPAELMRRELLARLRELVGTLPEQEQTLVRGVYFEGKTLQDAGRDAGISKSWASRLHDRALGRLADALSQMQSGARLQPLKK